MLFRTEFSNPRTYSQSPPDDTAEMRESQFNANNISPQNNQVNYSVSVTFWERRDLLSRGWIVKRYGSTPWQKGARFLSAFANKNSNWSLVCPDQREKQTDLTWIGQYPHFTALRDHKMMCIMEISKRTTKGRLMEMDRTFKRWNGRSKKKKWFNLIVDHICCHDHSHNVFFLSQWHLYSILFVTLGRTLLVFYNVPFCICAKTSEGVSFWSFISPL